MRETTISRLNGQWEMVRTQSLRRQCSAIGLLTVAATCLLVLAACATRKEVYFGPGYRPQEIRTIGLLPFGGVKNADAFADIFVGELIRGGLYDKIVQRSAVNSALGGTAQGAGEAEKARLAEAGRSLSIDAYLSGNISRYDPGSDGVLGVNSSPTSVAGTIKLIDAHTSETLWTVPFSKTAHGRGGFARPSLEGMVSDVSREIVRELRKGS